MKNVNPLKNKAPATAQTTTKTYENNPFFVATNGLELLFKNAKSVGIALAVLAGLSFLIQIVPNPMNQTEADFMGFSTNSTAISQIPMEVWIIIGMIAVVILITGFAISIIIRGVADFTSAQLAHNKTVSLNEALRGLFSHFWGYTWAIIAMQLKLFLWFLLFIVPGFVMSIRYSLTGVMYFDKQLKGGSASKQSAALTKGVWLTTYASHSLLNAVTLNAIPALLIPGTNAVLYRQFQAAGDNKPNAHVLSWIMLILNIISFVAFLVLLIFALPYLIIALASAQQ